MKSLYESLLTGKVAKPSAKVVPGSKKELRQIIDEHIKEIKPRPGQEVDLNWIDISLVKDLNCLFEKTYYIPVIDTWKIDHVYNFACMFRYNEHIVRSPLPALPKKLFSVGCCDKMFLGCTALKEPPVLPATELIEDCYVAMFSECRSLKQAPQLPATKLASSCYWGMFNNCKNLEEPPELPAKELVDDCYRFMFFKCTNLKRAPELPATKLAKRCYQDMFTDCVSLEERVKLPPGVALDYDYARNMYAGCPCENK